MKQKALAFVMLLSACTLDTLQAQTVQEMEANVQRYLEGISYWRFQYNAEDTSFGQQVNATDSVYAMNDSITHYLLHVAPKIPGVMKKQPALPENTDMNVILSADKKIMLWCWNTHTGSMSEFYNAVALYDAGGAVQSLKVADVSDARELQKASGEFVNLLSVAGDKGERYYIFLARVKMSDKDMLSIITAYSLSDNTLKTTELFSGGISTGKYITYVYDYMSNYDFGNMKETNTVHLSKNGRRLYIPEVQDGAMTGKWHVYNFDGSKFVYDKVE